ncbi:MAG: hypothetical protein SNJ69_06865 [Chloroflexaceae bacterium]
MWLWAFFLVVILIEVWYAFAFVYAYVQLRERMLLLPALQALLMLGVFGYLAYSLNSGQPASLFVVMPLLLGVLAISIFWRRSPAGLAQFTKSYPRGTLDVLSFRKPAADLKRRVRTK